MIHLSSSERKRQRGFTLMELLIVMSIMIILMLIAIPNFISMCHLPGADSVSDEFPRQRLRLRAARTRR
jgi:prepilin-type N-terminal cleavage/methylation domain-containing protein